MNSFQAEQNELLQTIFNKSVLSPVQPNFRSLELFITPKCNQACQYCYLWKNADSLFPKEMRNEETILKNADMVLEWYGRQYNEQLFELDLFSGEIWDSNLAFKLFDIIIKHIENGLKVKQVTIPSNMSFVNSNSVSIIERYMSAFERVCAPLFFSASIDGYPIENKLRPLMSGATKTTEYYDAILNFCARYRCGIHPMLSAASIEHWKDNLDWWIKASEDKLKQDFFGTVMLLEVRDDEWTDEKISAYLDFLDYYIDKFDKRYNHDLDVICQYIFNFGVGVGVPYVPLKLHHQNDRFSCSITKSLNVRLGDLALIPCHRTSYEPFIYGHLKTNEDKIIGIEAQNPPMAAKALWSNTKSCVHGCDICKYKALCMKGCLGAQYEALGDPFFPIPSVCSMFKAKFDFLIKRYDELGIIDYARKHYYAETFYALSAIDTIRR